MTHDSLPLGKPNDAPPPTEGVPFGLNPLGLHFDQAIVTPGTVRTQIADSSGTVGFPPIYGAAHKGDTAAAAQPAQAQGQTNDYSVKSGDSLWRIAKNSITHGDRHMHVNGEQIWQRIRDIVDANIAEHPNMRANPFFITKGEHLIVPGAANAPASAPQESHFKVGRQAAPDSAAAASHVRSHGAGPAASTDRPASERPASDSHTGGRGTAAIDGTPAPNKEASPVADGGHLANALKKEAVHQARSIDTVGSCSQGPRQTFEKFGLKIRPMPAVTQGELLEKSGMFDRVPAGEVQPGDYGYRHWSAKTIKRRGLGDLGDSFIVTDCSKQGWQAANDHMFTVPPGGGYYAPGITFLRPNAKFYATYEHYKQTGEKTHLS